jgi:ribosomal-protein-alanine N-acetyltransferase
LTSPTLAGLLGPAGAGRNGSGPGGLGPIWAGPGDCRPGCRGPIWPADRGTAGPLSDPAPAFPDDRPPARRFPVLGGAPVRPPKDGIWRPPLSLKRLERAHLGQIMLLEALSHPADNWTADNTLSEIGREIALNLGLFQSGRLLASLFAWIIPPEAHLLRVSVLPAVRRLGLGRTILAKASDLARSGGCASMLLEVRRGNLAARGLYRSLGFAADGVRPRYYGGGDDALLMTLPLGGAGAAPDPPDGRPPAAGPAKS